MPLPLPTYLITGLLGSGKTTLLQHLIQQKPQAETWAILINEFGEVDIDSAIINATQTQNSHGQASKLIIKSVAGGCICCSAQASLNQAINTLLNEQQADRLFIEPTGLGHPAQIIDVLKSYPLREKIELSKTVCVITPVQLTHERWEKSKVMRDFVTLADLIILNKVDKATQPEVNQALEILKLNSPTQTDTIATNFAQLNPNTILQPNQSKRSTDFTEFSIFSPDFRTTSHTKQNLALMSSTTSPRQNNTIDSSALFKQQRQIEFHSDLPGVIKAIAGLSGDENNANLISIGWVWQNHIQFKRTQLQAWFNEKQSQLLRAKGILKTGKEWQLIQWSEGELQFEDIAWRTDSRLEILFKPSCVVEENRIKSLENEFLQIIHMK